MTKNHYRRSYGVSFVKILSGVNAFEISNLQEQETVLRYPGDPDVTMLHGPVKLLNGFLRTTVPRWSLPSLHALSKQC
jgi:hypothetical protein